MADNLIDKGTAGVNATRKANVNATSGVENTFAKCQYDRNV